ncbi:uncharacterized protein LOC133524816 [Cydia pomonella]|uniref:uncharacterized protein LOC133524816 n=1 Tax=Cydia pomonella TaxID=82600 RepID=UPI002ADD637A|nr:uncharacterized protein LOC133524816 [Cydia pomonella]
MEWDKEKVLLFIDKYRDKEILWDPTHGDHFNKLKKNDAWVELSEDMNITVEEAKKKITSLLASLRREKAKIKNSTGTGKGADEIYTSTWFAFKPLLFVLDRNKPRNTNDTLNPDEESEQRGATVDTVLDNGSHTERPIHVAKKKKKAVMDPEEIMASTYDILKKTSSEKSSKSLDECDSYGAFIANKLRSYSNQTRNYVQHHISNILFNADRGQYEPNYGYGYSTRQGYFSTPGPIQTHSTRTTTSQQYNYSTPSPQMSDCSQDSAGLQRPDTHTLTSARNYSSPSPQMSECSQDTAGLQRPDTHTLTSSQRNYSSPSPQIPENSEETARFLREFGDLID